SVTKTQHGSEHLAVFLGAAAGALLGELMARKMRMAAIVFITPSLLPLVPGLGLYRTMLYVVQGDMGAAAALGADTLITLGLLALAVAAATLVMRLVWVMRKA
ncbi:MAG TPA: threonine/serine exporter family protein, partial [Clostridia bacterium]|nr:threonine/serine exporter family protein [Clostridia bacterium]